MSFLANPTAITFEDVERMSIQGRRLRFTGDFNEYFLISLKNSLKTFFTLGFYWFLGYRYEYLFQLQ